MLGWCYAPGIILESGQDSTIIDVDGSQYFRLSEGVMYLTLGHASEELTEALREQAGRFLHENS